MSWIGEFVLIESKAYTLMAFAMNGWHSNDTSLEWKHYQPGNTQAERCTRLLIGRNKLQTPSSREIPPLIWKRPFLRCYGPPRI